jgi:hypothetical protein
MLTESAEGRESLRPRNADRPFWTPQRLGIKQLGYEKADHILRSGSMFCLSAQPLLSFRPLEMNAADTPDLRAGDQLLFVPAPVERFVAGAHKRQAGRYRRCERAQGGRL